MKNNTTANDWLPRLIFYSILLLPALWIVPNYIRAKFGGNYTNCLSNLREMGKAVEAYAAEHDGYYPKDLSGIVPKYIEAIPTCPTAMKNTYSDSYRVSQDRRKYTFYCRGTHHRFTLDVPENYPQYDSERGLMGRP